MPMQMSYASEFGRTYVTELGLREHRLVALVGTHPRDGPRLCDFDKLAIDLCDTGHRLGRPEGRILLVRG